jgi:hypothetical protein
LIVVVTAFILLISPSWRTSRGPLAGQYLGVFLLLIVDGPFQLALTKLVTGIMAAAVLGMSISIMMRPGELPASTAISFSDEALEAYSGSPKPGGRRFFSREAFRLLTG